MAKIEPKRYARGGALDWRISLSYLDLPIIVPLSDEARAEINHDYTCEVGAGTDMWCSPYVWCDANWWIQTDKGKVTVFHWLMAEAKRLEEKGCAVVIVRRGVMICLFRGLTEGEIYPVTEGNVHHWRDSLAIPGARRDDE